MHIAVYSLIKRPLERSLPFRPFVPRSLGSEERLVAVLGGFSEEAPASYGIFYDRKEARELRSGEARKRGSGEVGKRGSMGEKKKLPFILRLPEGACVLLPYLLNNSFTIPVFHSFHFSPRITHTSFASELNFQTAIALSTLFIHSSHARVRMIYEMDASIWQIFLISRLRLWRLRLW